MYREREGVPSPCWIKIVVAKMRHDLQGRCADFAGNPHYQNAAKK